jgi:hypothetical protein
MGDLPRIVTHSDDSSAGAVQFDGQVIEKPAEGSSLLPVTRVAPRVKQRKTVWEWARLSSTAFALVAALLVLGMFAPATALASTNDFCFDSSLYSDLRGNGVYISECDLVALENGADAHHLLFDGIGVTGPDAGLIVLTIDGQLEALKGIDQGSGVYMLTPLVGPNVPIMYAR